MSNKKAMSILSVNTSVNQIKSLCQTDEQCQCSVHMSVKQTNSVNISVSQLNNVGVSVNTSVKQTNKVNISVQKHSMSMSVYNKQTM